MRILLLFLISFVLVAGSRRDKPKLFDLSEKQKEEGWYFEQVTNDIVKLMHPVYGYIKHVKLTAPSVSSTDFEKMHIQTIDLRNADTSLYTNMFQRITHFPTSGAMGYPIQIGDFNHNGFTDFYGSYKWKQDWMLAGGSVVEFKDNSNFELNKIYGDSLNMPLPISDLNKDGRDEINFRQNRKLAHLRSETADSFPDSITFLYRLWKGGGGAVGGETFSDLDKDGNMDLLFNADDTLYPAGRHKIFIAEYRPEIDNFVQTYRSYMEDWRTGLFCVGDFDNDSYMEFATGSVHGNIYFFENTGNDSYDFIYEDTLSTSNAYLITATNDLDNNGKEEIIIGGSSFFNGIGGTRFYWIEAEENNQYKKIRSFFIFGVDPLGYDEIHTFDVNKDGKDDILINYTYAVIILTWNNNDKIFEVYYLSYWNQEIHGVTMHDLNNDGKLDLFISPHEHEKIPAFRTYYFLNKTFSNIEPISRPVPVKFQIINNFPNPFNLQTEIVFEIKSKENVSLLIYNSLGENVRSLIENKKYSPGKFSITWDGKNYLGKEVSSGLYVCVLSNGEQFSSGKMLLIK